MSCIEFRTLSPAISSMLKQEWDSRNHLYPHVFLNLTAISPSFFLSYTRSIKSYNHLLITPSSFLRHKYGFPNPPFLSLGRYHPLHPSLHRFPCSLPSHRSITLYPYARHSRITRSLEVRSSYGRVLFSTRNSWRTTDH